MTARRKTRDENIIECREDYHKDRLTTLSFKRLLKIAAIRELALLAISPPNIYLPTKITIHQNAKALQNILRKLLFFVCSLSREQAGLDNRWSGF